MPLQRPEYQALWKEQTQKRVRVFNQADTNKTLKPSQTGSLITNLGSTGTVTITLPEGRRIGDTFDFAVLAGFALRIDPATTSDKIIINGAVQTGGKYIEGGTINESITLVYVGTNHWAAVGEEGTWTVEA